MSPAIFMFLIFAICIILCMPIAVCLGMSCLITMFFFPKVLSDAFIIQTFFSSTDSFPLLAIPFFILAGEMMLAGGISSRLVKMGLVMFGHFRAALGTVTIAASMFFAALSGSGAATVAAIGGLMIPEMQKEGYDTPFAASLSACGGAIGPVIPPSIGFVIYGVSNNVSVGSLLIAAVIPGVMMGIALIICSYIICRIKNFGTMHPRTTWKERAAALKDGIWALLAPVIILGGIYFGIVTPTEAAIIASSYALIVGVFIYKGIKSWRDLMKIFEKTVDTTGMCLVLMGTASLFGRILTLERVPVMIAQSIGSVTNNIYIILLLINIFMLIVGMFMEGVAAIVILSPILLNIVMPFGISPIHFGVALVINTAIGLCTPPVGINLFVASKVGNTGVGEMAKYLVPMIGSLIVVLLLVTYIPAISMFVL